MCQIIGSSQHILGVASDSLKDGKDSKGKLGKNANSKNSINNGTLSGSIGEGQEVPVRRLAIVKVYKIFSQFLYDAYAAASAGTPGAVADEHENVVTPLEAQKDILVVVTRRFII